MSDDDPVPPPPTTTTAPPPTTTAPPTTTTAPPTTTTAPPTTTTAPPTSTTAPPTSTTAPPTTTTAPPTTTTAPPTTTTAAPGTPAFKSVTVEVDPDDGADHHAHSLQVATDVKLTLKWEASDATGVHIEGLGDFDASGSQDLPASDATYSLVAKGDGDATSAPYPLEVHTHAPGDVVSPHVDLGSGAVTIVSFQATVEDKLVSEGKAGDEIVLTAVVSDGTESVKIGGEDADLSDNGDGHQRASVKVTLSADSHSFECQALKDGQVGDTTSVQVDVAGEAPTTTTAPGSTTTTPTDDSVLQDPKWGADVYQHGQTIQLSVDAPGVADGRVVYFAIEHGAGGGNWQPLQEEQAKVSGGKATTDPVMLKDPETGGASSTAPGVTTTADPSAPAGGSGSTPDDDIHNYRFHVSFTPSSGGGGTTGSSS